MKYNTNRQNMNNAEFDIEILEQRYKDTYIVDSLFPASKEGVDVNDDDVYLDFLIEAVGTPEEKTARKKERGKKDIAPLLKITPIPESGTTRDILERFRCHPSALHKRYEDHMGKEWKNNPDKFFEWVLEQMKEQKGDKLRVIHKGRPMGPDNCVFGYRETRNKDEDLFIKRVIEMAAPFHFNPRNKYKALVRLGELNPKKWTFFDFCKWTNKHIKNGSIAPYLNRLDISKPYSPTNCYFSFRPRNGRSHGMSKTHLYRKWTYFTRNYKDLLDKPVTLQEFMDYALGIGKYQLDCRMKVNKTGTKMAVKNVFFWSVEEFDNINRIMSVYRDIPFELNGFKDPMAFMEWTIRSGYSEWMDFKKVGRGQYSEKTCVWDIFTEEAYVANRGRRTYEIYKKAAKAANE